MLKSVKIKSEAAKNFSKIDISKDKTVVIIHDQMPNITYNDILSFDWNYHTDQVRITRKVENAIITDMLSLSEVSGLIAVDEGIKYDIEKVHGIPILFENIEVSLRSGRLVSAEFDGVINQAMWAYPENKLELIGNGYVMLFTLSAVRGVSFTESDPAKVNEELSSTFGQLEVEVQAPVVQISPAPKMSLQESSALERKKFDVQAPTNHSAFRFRKNG